MNVNKNMLSQIGYEVLSTSGKWVVWDSNRGTPKNPNPFHKGIPGIQTTGPQTTNLPLIDFSFHLLSWKSKGTPPKPPPIGDDGD